MEFEHERDRRRVVHGHDAGDHARRAQRHERADDPEDLVGASGGPQRRVAAGEHDAVRRAMQPLQVVDRQRPVVQLQGRQQWAVRSERPVRGDVDQAAPSIACSTRSLVASPPASTSASGYRSASRRTSSGAASRRGPPTMTTRPAAGPRVAGPAATRRRKGPRRRRGLEGRAAAPRARRSAARAARARRRPR